MSEETKDQSPKTYYKLSDDAIIMIRELVQMSFLTGTSIVDHFRAMRLELDGNQILPAEKYVQEHNKMVLKLEEQAREAQLKAQKTLATSH
jgi:predicted NAD-dependent protein-ADP-ribosyltransferase YbiA (DUF1768 family)